MVFLPHGSAIILILPTSNIFTKFDGVTPCGALNTRGYKNFEIFYQ